MVDEQGREVLDARAVEPALGVGPVADVLPGSGFRAVVGDGVECVLKGILADDTRGTVSLRGLEC